MGKFSNNWKRRNGNFLGFRSIIDIVCALEILGVVLFLVAPQFVMNYLILNPAAILHGQIWRIVTFLVYPPAITGSDAIMFVLMNALGIYCIRAFGTIVEQVWGRFRFNCYIIGGVLLHSVVAIGIYLVTGLSLPLFPTYLVYSFFFVFALMFPDIRCTSVNTLLPDVVYNGQYMLGVGESASWIAVAEAGIYIYSFITGGLIEKIEIVLSLILIGVFFGWMTFAGPSGFKQKKRSQEFQKTTQKMKVVKRGHKCAVCGRTDKDSPGMEFRYCSKCEGNYEYCMDHLYTHKHVKKEDADNSNSND